VLNAFRHKGIAQFLFVQMEAYIKGMGIDEYFLVLADNSDAQNLYRSIKDVEISSHDVLRKRIAVSKL